ncbi:MAG: diaminobutyrate--2-oxoglutarate transaminase [Acidimicrobiales bacterium]|nr:diaminobutyrate--2-oxoglutarate transaminase [Acidimicrobiales bacterium]
MEIFENLESEVRGYSRAWPTVFESARGHIMHAEDGTEYLDFFAGAGALNYGHNHPVLIDALRKHLDADGFIHGLDMWTTTKRTFMERFSEIVLQPRDLQYKLQFPGPTGTNAVEAALKLARKVTGRDRVVGFSNGFHGMTLGSLSVTGNAMKRGGAGVPLGNATSMPFANYLGDDVDSLHVLETMITGDSSGLDEPAAVIVETTQGEGGINPASANWMRGLDDICTRHGILLIIDDIQVGCGRTGPFFSWEEMGIDPDIVVLSKSLSGSGLPMALVLLKPEHDVWDPGEHNGTFRGNNAAFVTATAALEHFWADDRLTSSVDAKSARARAGLEGLLADHPGLFSEVRGRGLILGLEASVPEFSQMMAKGAFDRNLIIETAGAEDEVVKLLPPLTVTNDAIDRAMEILGEVAADFDEKMVEDLRTEREAHEARKNDNNEVQQ